MEPVRIFITGGTFASRDPMVVPSVVWAKFRALAEGAKIATERLKR